MTKMMLREFTESGHKEYKALIEEIFESVQKADKDISIAEFKSGFGAELYLEPQLNRTN